MEYMGFDSPVKQIIDELQAQLDAVTKRAESAEAERDALKAREAELRPWLLGCYHSMTMKAGLKVLIEKYYGQEVTETRVEVPRE